VDIVRALFKPPTESDERRAYYNFPQDEPSNWLSEGERLANPERYAEEPKKEDPSRGAK